MSTPHRIPYKAISASLAAPTRRIREQLERSLHELGAMRAELRSREHHAGIDVRHRLDALDARFNELREDAAVAGSDAHASIEQALHDLHRAIQLLRGRIETERL